MNEQESESIMVQTICLIIGAFAGFLMAMGLLSLMGCNSGIPENNIKRIRIVDFAVAYYDYRQYPNEDTESMTKALEEMKAISLDVCACLDEAYGTSIRDVSKLAVPKVKQISFKAAPFMSISGDREKVTECFGMSSVVCNYTLLRNEEGSWMLERWAAETESLYRNEVFGYSNIYNRNIPSPEQYLAAKECISKYKE